MIASNGGSQPVMFEAPVIASSRGVGSVPSAARTAAASNVPSGSHSTNRQVATRAHGRRFAWCSTTVVTTTSVGARRRR